MHNVYTISRSEQFEFGVEQVAAFAAINDLPMPSVIRAHPLPGHTGLYEASSTRITVDLDACARPSRGQAPISQSFPGHLSDRTPMGVVAHEFGHYVDHLFERGVCVPSRIDGTRRLPASDLMRWPAADNTRAFNQQRVSSYEPFASEAFAEAMRVFIGNPELLRRASPIRYNFLRDLGLRPLHTRKWDSQLAYLGADPRIIEWARRRIAKVGN